ncbi:MAG: hypothetical protein JWP87_699 [Labilithrix sp.]|nr:hypothetical protein [Labilithrix sp.]
MLLFAAMSEAVYEMFWDCKYCGQKKLLGLTHRFCAGCGKGRSVSSRAASSAIRSCANEADFLICHSLMRKLFLLSVLAPCVALLAGCPKKPAADADAGDEAAAPVAVVDAAPAAPVAKNVNDVARFPAEKPVTDDAQKTIDLFASVKTGCKSGTQVALMKAGTDPVKIAEFQDCLLVTFPDPKDATVTLMGWIPKDAFTRVTLVDAGIKDAAVDAPVDAAPAAFKCPAGQEAIVNLGTAPVCRKKCVTEKDCKTQTAGACKTATTLAGKLSNVCVNETP